MRQYLFRRCQAEPLVYGGQPIDLRCVRRNARGADTIAARVREMASRAMHQTPGRKSPVALALYPSCNGVRSIPTKVKGLGGWSNTRGVLHSGVRGIDDELRLDHHSD